MREYQIQFKNNRLVNTGGLNVESMGKNHYRISIANGAYQVRVYDGDLQDEGDVNVYTTLNGERQLPIWAGDRTIRSMVYLTEVTNGILDIEFTGKYVCIQGIDLAQKIEDKVSDFQAKVQASLEKCMVKLEFTHHSPYETIHLYKKRTGSGEDAEKIVVKETVYEDYEVRLGESYSYTARIANALEFEGEASEELTVKIEDFSKKKPAIIEFQAETLDETRIRLSWDCKECEGNRIAGYHVLRRTDLCNFKKIAELAPEQTSYVDDTMYTDRSFIYGIQIISEGGVSEIYETVSEKKAPLRRRQMETLDRGAVAVWTKQGMYLSFRLCADEYENAEFRIYADGELIREISKTDATNYLHKTGTIHTRYVIKKVENGIEEEHGYTARNLEQPYLDIPLKKPEPYTTPDGHTYEYTANDASVADLDGDGEYEIILKWDCNGKDNSHKGYSGIVYLDAYKLDGTLLWRINLGPNIRCGAHYTQFMVYDFDGDGYAEMVVKTADGTVDAAGNVVGEKDKDYRNQDGFIIEGPEYLSLIDGRTGVIVDTVLYDPPRGNVADWGDSWGNRVDRFLACVAYLDGVHPSVVMCRGYYDHGRPAHLAAYDIVDKKLVKRWKFAADSTQNVDYTNQGFHNLAAADVDGDGCDEIIYGACVIDHDGTGLYSTGLGHGDAMHVGKFTKNSRGFDYFGIHEDADCPYGIEAHEAGTGKMTFGIWTGKDTARGLVAKIDPRQEGCQMWAYFGGGLYNYADGSKITEKMPENVNFAIWWDGDLLRELLDHDWYGYETNVGIPKIYKWNWELEKTEVILSTDGVLSNNGTKGNPCIQASIFGDWREDVVFRGKDSTFLRLYTTTRFTRHRIYTLMHDAVYRLGVAWQNTAYNQPPHTGFYIGPDMEEVPVPNHNYVKAVK